jgi:NADPH2:quinone reductase
VAKAPLVIPAPQRLGFEAAAGICITYFTSMHALKQRAQLSAGETLLVLGAAGGVGTTAVELGKQMGASVVAAVGSDAKLELVRRLGADHVVNYATEDLRERLKELTGGKGVDVVYDPVGGTLAEPALRSMAWGGRYLVIGFAGGDIPRIPLNLPLLKGCSIVGVYWGSFAQREHDLQRRNVLELWELFESGHLVPVVGETHALADYAKAFESLATRRAQGKVVLVP